MKTSRFPALICATAAVLSAAPAFATTEHLRAFRTAYPSAQALVSCRLCHEPGFKRNTYGLEFERAHHDFHAIEPLDSDGDTVRNLDEINRGTFPGDKESH